MRAILGLFLVLGLGYLILTFSGRIYYDPICQRRAESARLNYVGYTSGRVKRGQPAECFFRDANGNMTRVQVSTIPTTSGDWLRWVLRWAAVIVGVGGSVWLASLVGKFKPSRRRRC